MNTEKRRLFFEILQRLNPTPKTELNYSNTFELLVAVVLSAQATDKSVNLVTKNLFAQANTPQAMLTLGEAGIADAIKSIGLYRNKAKYVLGLCQQILEHHAGQVPADRAALEALPGVGRKTANVILNTAFGQPTIAVDTHIFRVSNRTGLAPGKNVRDVERALEKNIPTAFLHDAHHWLVLHGRYICQARTPKCWDCAVQALCEYKQKSPEPAEKNRARPIKKGVLSDSPKLATFSVHSNRKSR